MTRRATLVPLMVGVVLVLAACGGSGSTSPSASDTGGGGTTATTAPDATEAPAAGATEDTSSGSGGGAFAGKVCDLLTPAEIEGVLGITGVTATETPYAANFGYCMYASPDMAVTVATSFADGAPGEAAWAAYAGGSSDDIVKVDGVGEGAVFSKSLGTLFVTKNGRVMGITAGDGQTEEAQRMEWEKALAALAAARL